MQFGMMFFDSAKQVREKNKQITIICILSFGVALILVVIISLPRLLSIEDSVINAAYCNDCGYSNCSQKYR